MTTRDDTLSAFAAHVSSGKVAFFKRFGMDFVMGARQGPFLYDLDGGKKLFNLHSNGGVFNLGHRHPVLVDVLKESLGRLDIGNHHLISAERAALARDLAALAPGDLDYAIFASGGGEAVDLAIKVARAHTGRSVIISARGGYHGHTGLAMAAGDAKYRQPFGPQPDGFVQVPFDDLPALEAVLDDSVAAVILETVPATLGMVRADDNYFPKIRRLCDAAGALLILDEVQTGLGRTGRLWGFMHYDLLPDMVIIGKGLSGGLYPISATLLRRPLEAVFHADPFIHISTFGGAELGCPVARKVLEISARPEFLSHVRELAERFREGIEGLQRRHTPFFRGLRQLGLMMGLELQDDLCGPILSKCAFDNDLLMVYANNAPAVCQCLPPLIMTLEEVPWVMERLDRALAAAADFRQLLG
jgi:acetylornithine/succinyldiaminopimelate/putrescine aminotransferase